MIQLYSLLSLNYISLHFTIYLAWCWMTFRMLGTTEATKLRWRLHCISPHSTIWRPVWSSAESASGRKNVWPKRFWDTWEEPNDLASLNLIEAPRTSTARALAMYATLQLRRWKRAATWIDNWWIDANIFLQWQWQYAPQGLVTWKPVVETNGQFERKWKAAKDSQVFCLPKVQDLFL